ncbi:Dps family protein [Fictibacillus terranigra]|uniref:Dps family protein n=1 Tax=Fictibacillus terranigra TaxID=3058424 RepID=A0ABT8E8Y4_9BACL|nr:Dps family protein [Fictibacillus sp. CENA-BCM004]MDN4074347.1 Dps family protein [Fictibacillus sp. CENA-BCM004]
MDSTYEVLNKQISNWNILYVKLHNYHWNVKGPHFFTLHEKFEELYNEANQHIDELAERLLMLQQQPAATMKQYLELATVKEASNNETSEGMVQEIIDDFALMRDQLKQGMEITEKENDEVTHDMLLSISSQLDKHTWMLTSFLA